MLAPEITVLDNLPTLETKPREGASSPNLANAIVEAAHVMASAYATHMGLTHLSGKLRVSCYHLEPVTFRHEDGDLRIAVGAVVGPKGRPPVLTVLVTVEGKPEVYVCPNARQWIDRFGAGRLPRDTGEFDLDRP